MKLRYMMFIVGVVMGVLALLIPCFIEMPKDLGKIGTREHSIKTSGIPPKAWWVMENAIKVVIICIGLAFWCSLTLDKSITCERDVVRVRRYWGMYNYLLLTGILLVLAQIACAFFGLLTIQRILPGHVFHSMLLSGLATLSLLTSILLFTWKYTTTFRRVPPSLILRVKGKGRPL